MKESLFIGVTSWNSRLFLGHALDAIRRTTQGLDCSLTVWDNASQDDSVEIARGRGAEVIVRVATQADALNGLWNAARTDWVLLIHADVILLDPNWFPLCVDRARRDRSALLAPEDIGCGPYTRPFGKGMPESSFLFLDRSSMRRLNRLHWRRAGWIPHAVRGLDLYGEHLTHRLPARLAAAGLKWTAMNVQTSETSAEPIFGPYPRNVVWNEELARLRYGLGNFYGIDGVITHYHNWYERIPGESPEGDSPQVLRRMGFPPAYIRDYTRAFLADLGAGRLSVPAFAPRDREPVAL